MSDGLSERHNSMLHNSSQDNIDQLAETQPRKVSVSVKRGQAWRNNQEDYESVFLCATPSRVLYMQRPRMFVQQDSNSSKLEKQIADIKRLNDDYAAQVKYNREHLNQQDQMVQTMRTYYFSKQTATERLQTKNQATDANFVDINSRQTQMELNQVKQDQQENVQFQDKNTAGQGVDYDDGGSVYTGKDDTVSDAGTQYTQGTQRTATQSLNSVGSSVQNKEDRQTQQSAEAQKRIFQDRAFIQNLILAEMLALQQPLLPLTTLFRGGDIQYDPKKDYKRLLEDEFKVADPNRQKISTKLLFTYKNPRLNGLKAVYCDFSLNDERLLLVGYSGASCGALALWQPENPDFYKVLVHTRVEVTCCKFFPTGKSIVAVGFGDGSVGVVDFREENLKFDQLGFVKPVLLSTNKTGKHTSRVWELGWVSGSATGSGVGQHDALNQQYEVLNDLVNNYHLPRQFDAGECDNLISVATDGRVVERSLRRNFEQHDILTLVQLQPHPVALVQQQKTSKMTIIRKLAAGLSLDFLNQQDYLVAGDDAVVRRASRSYSEQTSQTYQGHLSSIYRVRVNQCSNQYFLTASADRTTRIWDVGSGQSLATLRTTAEEHVYAAEWCPYKSTLLVTGAKDGLVEVWDLTETAVCPVLRLERPRAAPAAEAEDSGSGDATPDDAGAGAARYVCFSKRCPVFCVCYDNGWVQVHRLFGIENGFLLRSLDIEAFLQVEHERMRAVVQNSQAE